jgi:DNA-binding response OmpR family regulator
MILLVEDDAALAGMLMDRLRARGYEVWHAEDGAQADAIAAEIRPDLFILDLMLPDTHGLVLCANLREQSAAPIIICSATKRKEDPTLALKLGAVDFLAKPFSADELERCLEHALQCSRRSAAERLEAANVQTVGPLTIDHDRRRVTLGDQVLPLTPTEYRLLCLLAAHLNAVVSRQELAEHVWGSYDSGIGKSLETHLRRLRGKLKQGSISPLGLLAVRGFGYRLAWTASDGGTVPAPDLDG